MQAIRGTRHGTDAFLHDTGVDFRGFHIGVAHQLPDNPDIDTVFEKVPSVTVAIHAFCVDCRMMIPYNLMDQIHHF